MSNPKTYSSQFDRRPKKIDGNSRDLGHLRRELFDLGADPESLTHNRASA